jgi:hypothetical protein
LSRLEPPTGTKGPHFVPVGVSNRDKKPMSPMLARLAVGPGTKAIYCSGPKGCRDKWPGTKACSVVVEDGSEDRIYLRYPRITWQMINYDSNRKYSRSSYIIFVATICASLAESVRQPTTTTESLSILGSMMDVQLFARNCTPQRIGDMLLCAAYNMVARPCRFVLGAQANTVRQIRHGSLTS